VRFCPFCSAENADELAVCASCGRRLPPLPPRRARNAPPTGVQLPPRATTPAPPPVPPRRSSTIPPPLPGATSSDPQPSPRTTQPFTSREAPDPHDAEAARRALLSSISPGPAALRREAPALEAPSPEDLDPSRARRHSDPTAIPSVPRDPSRGKPITSPPPPPAPIARPPVPAPPVLPASDPDAVHVAANRLPSPSSVEPPATRIQRNEALVDRPFTPPMVSSVPEIPEPGLVNAARYTLRFGRARWQRRGAIKMLGAEIKQDTDALDQVLGALGREARNARVESRVLSAENAAISAAEGRIAALGKEQGDVDARKGDENSKFLEIERERNTKLGEAERLVDEAQKELSSFEAQRRGLRDKRKELERRQKAYLKNAEDNDRQAGSAQLGDARQELRRSAEGHRKEAAALEPERQDIDRRLASLERPIGEATARLDAAKAELDAAKRSLNDAREGHTHRLAELDAEQKRKLREIGLADGEILRRLVTLGTLVNLNRIEDAQFTELYQRIDRIRGAITARTTEIEKLTAEREAYDRGTLVRGVSTIGAGIILFIALIVILRAII